MEDDTGGEDTSDYSSLSDELKNIQNHIKLTRDINVWTLKLALMQTHNFCLMPFD